MQNRQKRFIAILSFVLIMLTTFAYSALATNLSITGEANFRTPADIRVTSIAINEATGAVSEYAHFKKDTITTGFTLDSTTSSMSYNVTITNKGDQDYVIYDLITQSSNNAGLSMLIDGQPINTALPIAVPFGTSKTITITYSSSIAGRVDVTNKFDFRKLYYVEYNLQGGSSTDDDLNNNHTLAGRNYGQLKYENVTLSLSNSEPTKSGYRFTGWNTKQDGTGTNYSKADNYTENSNKILYAMWERSKYAITFDSHNGEEATTKEVVVGDPVGTLPSVTKDGYQFQGWFTQESGGTQITAQTVPNSDTTYHAHWTAYKLTINYYAGSATKNGNTTLSNQKLTTDTYDYDGEDLKANGLKNYDSTTGTWNLKKDGYHADKYWHLNNNTSNTKVHEDTKIAKIQDLADSLGKLNNFKTGDVEVNIYAGWTANTYTLHFDKNNANATGVMSDQTLTYDAQEANRKINKNIYTLTGHTFAGWNTQANGQGTAYTDEQVINLVTTNNETVNLYAQWIANTYTAYYDLGGSGSSAGSKIITYGLPYGTLNQPTKTGYTFDGWYNTVNLNKIKISSSDGNWNWSRIARVMPGNTYTVTIDNAKLIEGTASEYTIYVNNITAQDVRERRTGYFNTSSSFTIDITDDWSDSDEIYIIIYSGKAGETSGVATEYSNITVSYETEKEYTSSTVVDTTSNQVLYAHWTPNNYTVTLDPTTGGLVSPTSKTVTYDSTYGNLPDASKTGYTFTGWAGKNLFNEDKYKNLDNYTFMDSPYKVAKIYLKASTTYRISITKLNGFDGKNKGTLLLKSDLNHIYNGNYTAIAHSTVGTYSNNNFLITTGSDGIIYIGYGGGDQSNLNYIFDNLDVMIEEGSTATTYEPYKIITSSSIVKTASNHTLTAVYSANELTFNDQTPSVTYNASNTNTINIVGASNGTGSYTYSKVSEKKNDTDTTYFTVSGTSITAAANTPAGTYTVVVKATDNNSGMTKNATYTITVNRQGISVPTCGTFTYNKSTQTLINSTTSYTASNNTGLNAGNYNVSVTPTSNYQWSSGSDTTSSRTVACTINPYNISGTNSTVVPISSNTYTYDGTAKTPEPSVLVPLPTSSDSYTLTSSEVGYTYSNNTNAGTATVTVTGTGNYTGSKDINFTINKAQGYVTLDKYTDNLEYTTSSYEFNVLTHSGNVTVTDDNATATVSIDANGKVTISNISTLTVGTDVTVTVSSAANTNYTAATETFILHITHKPIIGGQVKITGNNIVGNTLTASITEDTTPVGTYSYKWYRGTTEISGATSSTYTVTSTDVGQVIKVVVTSSKANYESISFEDATDATENKTETSKTGVTKPTTAKCSNPTYNATSQVVTSAAATGYAFYDNSGTDAGSYTVTAKLSNNYIWSNGDTADVTINCSIAQRVITVKASNQSKTYDGTALSANNTCEVTSGSLAGSHTLSCTASGSITDYVSGGSTKTLSTAKVMDSTTDVSSNYNITKANGTLTINKRNLTIKANNQTIGYGSSISSTPSDTTVTNLASTDSLNTISLTTDKTAVGSYTDAITASTAVIKRGTVTTTSNYNITYQKGNLTINKKNITVNIASCSNKQYDRSTTATCSITPSGVQTGETATVTATCTFNNKNAGTNKEITCNTFVLDGTHKDNYNITTTSLTGSANITTKPITPTATASNKIYDGNANATCNISLPGIISGDTVNKTYTGTFNNKNVGTSKAVTCSDITLTGDDKDNYSLSTDSLNTTANITAKEVAVSWTNAGPFTYNGSNQGPTAQVNTGITGETMTVNATKAINKGTHTSTATCTSVTGSSSCGNYTLTNTTKEFTINAQAVNPVTNLSVNTSGVVSWTASSNATGYQISIDESTWTDIPSSQTSYNYLSVLTASSSNKTVYVRAINSDTDNYSTVTSGDAYAHSSNVTKAVTIRTLTVTPNNSNYGSVSNTTLYAIDGATYSTSENVLTFSTGSTLTATSAQLTGYTTTFSSWSPASGTINANITITANFARSANNYTVTANSNGGTIASTTGWTGTGNSATKSVTYDSAYGTLPTVSRTGYDFDGWTLLPNGYKQVEYIQSSGTQYIDTGYYWQHENIEIYFDGTVLTNGSSQSLFGNEENIAASGNNRNFAGIPHGSGGTYGIWVGNGGQANVNPGLNTRFEMDINTTTSKKLFTSLDGELKIDKTYTGTVMTHNTAYISSEISTTVGNIFLFANHNSYNGSSNSAIQNIGSMRVYSFKLIDNGELVRDMVPCYNESTGKYGMYDLVNSKFYGNTNSTGSDFTAPSEDYYITSETLVNTPSDHNIYAHWSPITYNLTYDLRDGSVATANPTTYNVETNTFTLNNPTRTGYTFDGWTGSNGNTPSTSVSIAKGSTGDKSYTANWSKAASNLTVTLSSDSYTYNGSAKTPTVTVKDGSTTIPSTEYDVTYSNNTNAGTASVTITMKGNYYSTTKATYTGSKSTNFTINRAGISLPTCTTTYDKTEQTLLSTTTTYTVASSPLKGTNAGEYKVNVTPTSNYKWSSDNTTTAKEVTCVINKKELDQSKFTTGSTSKTYNGNTNSSITLTANTDSGLISGDTTTISYSSAAYNNANVASADTIYVVGIASSNANYSIKNTSQTYAGTITRANVAFPSCSAVTYNKSEQTLFAAHSGDYSNSVLKATNAGTYQVALTPDANHKWTDTGATTARNLSCTINKYNISSATVSTIPDHTYNATQYKPTPSVIVPLPSSTNTYTLTDEEITYSYSAARPISAGTYTVTITAKDDTDSFTNNYTGSTSKTYNIVQANGYVNLSDSGVANLTYGTASKQFTVTSSHGGTLSAAVTSVKKNGSNVSNTVAAEVTDSTVTVSNLGTLDSGTQVVITVTSAATTNYKVATATYTINVTNAALSGGSVAITGNNVVGETLTATITNTSPTANYTCTWYKNTSDSTTGGTSLGAATISSNKCTYTLTSNEVGKYIYVVINATKDNYTATSFNNKATTANNKTATVKTKVTKPTTAKCSSPTYNGSSQTITSTADTGYAFSNNSATNYSSTGYDVTATLSTNYIWSDYTTANHTINCNITRRPVTYTADSASKTYNGSALTKQTATLTSGTLVSGHSATFSITGTQTNAGSSTNTLNSVTITDGSSNNVTSNYNITKVNGTLTVNKADASCTINSSPTLTYPGATTGNITYSCSGDGALSVTSSDTSVITVGTIGSTSTPLTAKKIGSSTISVSRAAGTNYNAASAKTSTVNVTGTIYHVTLDNQSATSAGTTDAYYSYGTTKTVDGTLCYYYTDSTLTTCLSNGYNITKPTKTGYTFGGYYTGTNGTGTQHVNNNGSFVNNIYLRYPSQIDSSYTDTIPLYAKWTAKTPTVTANANGGTIASTTGWTGTGNTATKSVTYDSVYGTLPTVSKTGYTFAGWTNENTIGSQQLTNKSFRIFNATSYYQPKYEYNINEFINFDVSVSNSTIESVEINDVSIDSSTYTNLGQRVYGTIPVTNEIREHFQGVKYKFLDINTLDSYSTYTINKFDVITTDQTINQISENHDIYAKWSPNTYKVKFNANNGSGTMSDQSFTYDEAAKALTTNTFTRTGYTFAGWNTQANGQGTAYTNGQSVSNLTSTANGTFNLYAQWIPKQLTVVFNKNDGTNTTSQTTYTYDGNMNDNNFTPASGMNSRTGYTFAGWSLKADGSDNIRYPYTDMVGETWFLNLVGNSQSKTVNLYAQWTINSHTLTINPNGGSYNNTTSNTTITQNYNTTTTVLNNATRAGYNFEGWQLTSGDGTIAYDEESELIKQYKITGTSSTKPEIYNNLGNGNVTQQIVSDSTSSTGYSLQVTTNGKAYPGAGGVYPYNLQATSSKVYYHVIKAKIPTGYSIQRASNSRGVGGGDYWITDTAGTNEWKTYIYATYTGANGPFGTFGHIYVAGPNDQSVTWNIQEYSIYQSDDIEFTFKDSDATLTALWNNSGSYINFDYQNGSQGTGTLNGNGSNRTNRTFYYQYTYNTTKVAPYYIDSSDNAIYRDGYTFGGFYTQADGGTKLFDTDGSLIASVSPYTNASKVWQYYDSSFTTYAKWTKAASNLTVTLSQDSYTYNGGANTPTVTVKDGTTTIPSSEYDVTYSNNTNVGTATATVTMKGNYYSGTKAYYTGSTTANFTISKKALTPTVSASNKTYNGNTTATCSTTVTLTGIVGSDAVTATANASGTFADKNVGTGKQVTCSGITLSGNDSSNYSVASSATTTANITAKSLSVTAENKSKTYGQANPTLTYTVSGQVGSESPSVTGNLATTATTSSNVGSYDITQGTVALASGTVESNYSISFTKGTLTINKADNPMSVTASQSWSPTYSTSAQDYTFTAASNAQGSVTYAITSQKQGSTNVTYFSIGTNTTNKITMAKETPVGTYTVKITASAAGNDNYSSGSKEITLTVTVGKAACTLSVTNGSMNTGTNMTLSSRASGNKGTLSYALKTNGRNTTTASTISSGTLTAGAMSTSDDDDQYVDVTITDAGNANYSGCSKDVVITVSKYTRSLSWNSSTPAASSTLTYGTSYSAVATTSGTGGTQGAITYSSNNESGATINSSTGAITVVNGNSKSVTMTASLARTSTVKAASITRAFTTGKTNPTITLNCASLTYNKANQNLLSSKSASGSISVYIAKESLTASNYTTKGSTDLSGAQGQNAGSYTVYAFTPATDNYNSGSTSKSCSIAKYNISSATVSTIANHTYDGNVYKPTPSVTVPLPSSTNTYTLLDSEYDYSYSTASPTTVGEYTVTMTAKSDSGSFVNNYTGSVSKKYNIVQANGYVNLTPTGDVATYGTASKTFTISSHHGGTLSVDSISVTKGGSAVTNSVTATISNGTVTVSNLGTLDSGTKVEVTIKSAATTNYKQATAKYTLNITNAAISGCSNATVSISDNNVVGEALTSSMSGLSGSGITYTYQWYTNTSDSTTGGSAIGSATSSSYTLTSSQVGKYIYVKVIANQANHDSCEKYAKTSVSANKTATVKTKVDKPTASAKCANPTYNGSSQTLTNTATTGYAFSNNSATNYNASGYDVTATLSTNYIWSDYTTANTTINCNITRKSVGYTASNQSKTYDGTALNADATCSLTSGALVSGHSATCSNTGSITYYGTTGSATKTLSSVTIVDSNNNDVTPNYNISKTNGTLSITKKSLTITPKAQTIIYGNSIATGTSQVNVTGLASGDSLTAVTLTPSTSNVTTTGTITASAATVKKSSTDVTTSYSIDYSNTGALTINNAKVTFNATENGGSISGTSPLYTKKGVKVFYTTISGTTSATIPLASKTGYTFTGWYTSGGTQVIDASRNVKASVSNWTDSNGNFTITSDQTLYAQYSVNDYTITYDYNVSNHYFVSGTYLDSGYTIDWDKNFQLTGTLNYPNVTGRHLIAGSYNGSKFISLEASSTSGAMYIANGSSALKTGGTFAANADFNYTFDWTASNQTAAWTATGTGTNVSLSSTKSVAGTDDKTVRYGTTDHRGSTVFNPVIVKSAKISKPYTYGGKLTDLPSSPTRTGYSFVGWYTTSAASGGTQVTTSTNVPSANTTYYARWSANALTFGNQTVTSTFNASSAQTITNGITEATNGTGKYTYAITAGNSNSYFSLSGRNIVVAANTPANTTGYSVTITATDDNSGVTKDATYTIKVNKATNPMSVTAAQSLSPTFNTSAQDVTFTAASSAQGTVTYAITSQKQGTTNVTNFSIGTNTNNKVTMAANTPVGTYTVVLSATAAGNSNYNSSTKEITLTITVGRKGVAFPSCTSKAYNGTSQTLFAANSSGAYTNSAITGTTVGSYSGDLTPTSNYQWSSGSSVTSARSLTCSITQTATTTTASNVSVTYSKSAVTGSATAKYNSNNANVSGGTITYTYYNGSSCSGDALTSAPTNWRDGGYSYTATLTGTTNYATSTSECKTLVINKKELDQTKFTASNTTKTYDGNTNKPSGFALSANTTSGLISGDSVTVSYSTATYNDSSVASASSISVTGISINNTNYSLKGTTGSYTASITRANNPTTFTAATGLKYGSTANLLSVGSAQGTPYYAVGTQLTSSNYSTAGSTTIPTATSRNADTYTVYYYIPQTANYNEKSGNVSVTIGKATNAITLTCANPTYTGSAQNLLSAKTATGGDVYIATTSLTSSNYSTSGSTALSGAQGTNAKSYTVYAYTPGNGNYDAKSDSKSCSISKANNPTTFTAATGLKYGSTANLLTVGSSQGTPYYAVGTELTSSNYSTSGSTTIPTATSRNVGTYTVYYYIPEVSEKYNVKSGSVSVTISKAQISKPTNSLCKCTGLTTCGSSYSSFAYTGAEQQLTTATSGTGYTLSDYNKTTAGSQTVTATTTSNYEYTDGNTSTTFTCYLPKATPVITLSASSGTINAGATTSITATVKSGASSASVSGSLTAATTSSDVARVSPTSTTITSANNSTGVETSHTITGVAGGSANINFNFAPTDTTNYNSASQKQYTATSKNKVGIKAYSDVLDVSHTMTYSTMQPFVVIKLYQNGVEKKSTTITNNSFDAYDVPVGTYDIYAPKSSLQTTTYVDTGKDITVTQDASGVIHNKLMGIDYDGTGDTIVDGILYTALTLNKDTNVSTVTGAGNYLSNQSASISASGFTTGYHFGSWSVTSGNTPTSTTSASTTVSMSQTTKLKANAAINTYSIAFNKNAPSGVTVSGSMSNLTSKNYNTSVTLTANAYNATGGYTFVGWNTKADGTGTAYLNSASMTINSALVSQYSLQNSNGTITLYAQWIKNGSVIITGTAIVGQTLTASVSAPTPAPTSYSYQWYRKEDLGEYTAISGATNSTYTLTNSDFSRDSMYIKVVVTAVYTNYSSVTFEDTLDTSHNTYNSVYKNYTTACSVTVQGDATKGSTLNPNITAPNPEPYGYFPAYKYQWYRNGSAISGATSSTYTTTASDVGSTIKVVVIPKSYNMVESTGKCEDTTDETNNKSQKIIEVKATDLYYDNTNTGMTCETAQCALDNVSRILTSSQAKSQGNDYLCKRASSSQLHTATISGSAVTFGQVGTAGTLTAGDAFICDVNGDGLYNATNEMFYYVSDYYNTSTQTTNSEYATLIYYSNVSAGSPSIRGASAYDSTNVNNRGPITGMTQLPQTLSWQDAGLYNNTRLIASTSNLQTYGTSTGAGDTPTAFSYKGYSARFLDTREVKAGCPNASTTAGSLDSCNFLLENTYYQSSSYIYSYWLENPNLSSSSNTGIWNVNGYTPEHNLNTHNGYGSGSVGVRPAIEVKKTDIDYNSSSITGLFTEGSNTYYYINGTKQTGLKSINGTKYYFNSSGVMQTGWQQVNDIWYYFDPSTGRALKGWQQISGSWYYFNTSGEMQHDRYQLYSDGYYYWLDTNGASSTVAWNKTYSGSQCWVHKVNNLDDYMSSITYPYSNGDTTVNVTFNSSGYANTCSNW